MVAVGGWAGPMLHLSALDIGLSLECEGEREAIQWGVWSQGLGLWLAPGGGLQAEGLPLTLQVPHLQMGKAKRNTPES